MSIFIRTANEQTSGQVVEFTSEAELEEVVASRPELLTTVEDQPMAFVARQVDLPDAGLLDLLFVNKAGLPIATEVKLAKNGEARRQIVAQIVDYLSSLTCLTVDELDDKVAGALEVALRSFDKTELSDDFERRWQAVGANLRAGLARLILVLDALPLDLERIVRFLSEHTTLDIRVVTVTKHEAGAVGTVFVPHVAIVADDEPVPLLTKGPRPLRQDFAAVIQAYDNNAPSDLQTHGTAPRFRKIRPPEWPAGFKVHYEFTHTRRFIGVELHLENRKAGRLGPDLARFSGTKVGPRNMVLEWDPKWSGGYGRLMVRYDIEEDPQVIVATMVDLIDQTRRAVVEIAARLGNT